MSSARQRSSVSSSSARSLVLHRREQLHARVEVARHQVGRADVVARARRRGGSRRSASARGSGPTTETTRMFSLTPGTPGPQAADAADVEVDPHAGLRRLVEGLDAARVHERVHLHHDPRVLARRVRLDRAARSRSRNQSRMWSGATTALRYSGERAAPVSELNRSATSAVISAVAGEEAEVLVQPRGLGVVVAGADVHVVAHARRPRGAPRAAPWRASSAPAGRAPRARPPPPARAPSRCCGARRSAPSAPRGRRPACRARRPRSATAPAPSRPRCGTRSS